jgi:GTP-binding protein HflX
MSRVGEENALFISATNKENFEELRERLYEDRNSYYVLQ